MDTVLLITQLTSLFFQLYPCVILCYIPFLNDLKRPFKKIILEALIASIVFIIGLAVLELLLGEIILYQYSALFIFIFLIPGFFYYKATVSCNIQKLSFVFFMIIHAGNITHSLSMSMHMFTPIAFYQNLISIAIRILFYLPLGFLLYYNFAPKYKLLKPNYIKGLWIIPIALFIIQSYWVIAHYQHVLVEFDLNFFIFVIIFTLISFLTYFLLVRLLGSVITNIQLEANISVMDNRLKSQGEHYQLLQSHIIETKRARHDLRHHLAVIKTLSTSGNNEKLVEYIEQFKNSLPDVEMSFCENFAVNSLLFYYAGNAKNEGISLDINLELPEDIDINDTDLCIVFGNLIENAIEACQKLDDGKHIKVKSKITKKLLAITVDNSFDGFINNRNGVFVSTKPNGEGIGLSSVKAVAEKYGGSAKFEVWGKIFQASVLLRIGGI